MIDYFDVNFWFDGVKIDKWDKLYKIVEHAREHVPEVEYENVEITKTRTYKTLEPKEISMSERFEHGQLFRLKSNFNYGCAKGAV